MSTFKILGILLVLVLVVLANVQTRADFQIDSEHYSEEFNEVHYVKIRAATIAYHKAGHGPALVLFHGFPLSGLTWRKIVPALSKSFTCYAFDVIGFGGSDSDSEADFSSQGQARVFQKALVALNVRSFALLGNDSGGWIARELALLEPEKVTRMVLTNTEIPNHRPPWIPQYQEIARLPWADIGFREMLRSKLWRHSNFGFGGTFQNHDLIDGEFGQLFLWPLLNSKKRMSNALKFLRNMNFERVDGFARSTISLAMPVLLLWGDADPTFPVKYARGMESQFPNSEFQIIVGGKLFIQEEFPAEVAKEILAFLTGVNRQ